MSLMSKNRVRSAAALASLILAPALAAPPSAKMDGILAAGAGDRPVRVIVQGRGSVAKAARSAMGLRGTLVGAAMADGSAVVATADAAALQALAANADVERVSLDAPVSANVAVSKQSMLEPGIATASALAASLGTDGAGVTVAVIDSGIARVPGLRGKVSAVYDAVTGQMVPPGRSADAFGHGTHVGSIIAGRNSSTGFTGVAPGASLISLRVLDQNGNGYTSDVIRALDWCVANRERHGIRVVNLSVSHPPYESWKTDPLCQAVRRATEAGLLVVCSAGNWGYYGNATVGSPGNSPFALTVGAVDTHGTAERADDNVASFSSRGPTLGDLVLKPDVVAPGNRIAALAAPGSTLVTEPGASVTGPYLVLSGTSMSAPMVSGLAALMLSRTPNAGPAEIKARMMATAAPVAGSLWSRGAGMVNAFPAVWSSVTPGNTYSVLSPACVNAGDGNYDLVDPLSNESILWADRVVWGDGPLPLPGELEAFATRVVWGDGPITVGDEFTAATRVVWGDGPLPAPGDDPSATRVVWGDGPLPAPGDDPSATRVVWGDGPLPDTLEQASATRVVWGDGPLPTVDEGIYATRVVWGDGPIPSQTILLYGE